MDIAKLTALAFSQNKDSKHSFLLSDEIYNAQRRYPLVLAPTTCGTGSEATIYAVVTHGSKRISIENPSLLPDVALVDPVLAQTTSPMVAATSAVDALCQSVESYWSTASTPQSRVYAAEALNLISTFLVAHCVENSDEGRAAMSRAATLSGRAISITRTTSSHSLSYPLTSHFGIAHGHACFLTLPHFMKYNSDVTESDCQDARGAHFVRSIISDITAHFNCSSAEMLATKLTNIGRQIGLKMCLSELNVGSSDIEYIVENGFELRRMSRNPRLVTPGVARSILEQIL